jgi:hypothetical protein
MKESTKWGLILQIPNLILVILAIGYLIVNINLPSFNLNMIAWIIFGTMYGLMNIASLILLVSGINND